VSSRARAALPALLLLLLAACASQPPEGAPPPGAPPQEAGSRHAAPGAAPALAKPLDATRLPPFEGKQEEVRKRSFARIDRTVHREDLWQRIRDGFGMPDLTGPLVDAKTAWYVAHPEYLQRVFERSRMYLFHIVDELEKRGLPTELALLPMVESSYNPMAYSRAHASGLWQFVPGTGKRYELDQNWWYDGRRDIVASTAAALDYLQDLYDMQGDWQLALASYNWGENAVARAMEKNRAAGLPLDYSHLQMPQETREYVPKLQALKNIISNPALFGIRLDPIPNQPYFAPIERTLDIDVRLAAKLAEMPVEDFIALNPGFSRPVIRAEHSPRIVLPADKVEVFHENLTKYDGRLVTWQTYQPRHGESLEHIARKFKVSLAQLKEVNGISHRSRHVPSLLVVPAKGSEHLGHLPIMYSPPIPAAPAHTIVHVVRHGETLGAIARRYRVTVEDLRRWNRIGRLLAGQKLFIHTRVGQVRRGHIATAEKNKKNR